MMAFLHRFRSVSKISILSISKNIIYNPRIFGCVKLMGSQADCKPEPEETFDEKNARLGRPQSPHLSIYKPQLITFLSISHRFSGIILSSYIGLFGIGCLFCKFSEFYNVLENLNLPPSFIFLGKVIFCIPVLYHLVFGIRHLIWDTGRFLLIKQVYITCYVFLTLFFASLAYILNL